jgi:hypothetical protein
MIGIFYEGAATDFFNMVFRSAGKPYIPTNSIEKRTRLPR